MIAEAMNKGWPSLSLTRSEYRWLAAARSGLLFAAIVLGYVFVELSPAGVTFYSKILSFLILVLWIGDLIIERLSVREKTIVELIQVLLAATITTGVIYITGGPSSPFVTLYLPLTMLVSIQSKRSIALIFVGTVSIIYGLLYWTLTQDILPASNVLVHDYTPPGGAVAHFVGLYSALFLISVATGFLVRHVKASNDRADLSSKELEQLASEREVLASKLRSVEEQLELQERMARLLTKIEVPQAAFQTKIHDFIGESQIMQQVFKLISRVAPSEATTLISGESGTGKELVARAIHLGSGRAEKKFIVVNCGAIPESLIESELFGHKKGSFTGAISDHIGLFQEAEGGSIFLDEIGELPLHMQAKLLRVLQERTIKPIGSSRDINVDVRIIAATNRNLKNEVKNATFREDLFYRLNVISVHLPALRDRKEDIPFLVNAILRNLVKNGPMPVVTSATMRHLADYNYPGNVRELENILERAVVLGGEAILPEHLPDFVIDSSLSPLQAPKKETIILESSDVRLPIRLDDVLSALERRYLEVALVQTRGAKKKAADLLGMNFRSFRYRLQKFGISEDGLSE